MKIAVANQKGGVGKTTISWNLASGLAKLGYKTLVIDNDPQGNLTSYALGDAQLTSHVLDLYDGKHIEPQEVSENLFLYGANKSLSCIPERGIDGIWALKEGLAKIENGFKYTIIDCLPGLENLLLASLIASDQILIPLKPAPFPLLGLRDLLDTIDRTKNRFHPNLDILGIVLNFVDSHEIVMEREIVKEIAEMFPDKLFKTKIIKRVKLEESTGCCQSIFDFEPKGYSAKNFNDFIKEVIQSTSGGQA